MEKLITAKYVLRGKAHTSFSHYFLEGNALSENCALAKAAKDALGWKASGAEVSIVYVNRIGWEDELKHVYKEIPFDENLYTEMVAFNPLPYLDIDSRVLEIIPDWRYNSGLGKKLRKMRKNNQCTNWIKLNENIEFDNAAWWYLHGKVEDKVGYDKGVIVNCNKLGISKDTVRWLEISGNECIEYKDIPRKEMCFNGIIRCNVVGVNKDCLGFFYTNGMRKISYDKGEFDHWNQKGYVVAKSDTFGIVQALSMYLLKSDLL